MSCARILVVQLPSLAVRLAPRSTLFLLRLSRLSSRQRELSRRGCMSPLPPSPSFPEARYFFFFFARATLLQPIARPPARSRRPTGNVRKMNAICYIPPGLVFPLLFVASFECFFSILLKISPLRFGDCCDDSDRLAKRRDESFFPCNYVRKIALPFFAEIIECIFPR